MINTDHNIIIRALIDGRENNTNNRPPIMLVPQNQPDNATECIHYKNGFQHVSTDGIEPLSKDDVRERLDTWTLTQL